MSKGGSQSPFGELTESGVATVAFAEIEHVRVRRAMDAFMQQRRPPPHIRPKLDLGFRVTGQSVEIFAIRPRWCGPPDEKHESPVAKAKYVRARGVWRVFLAATRPEVARLRTQTGSEIRGGIRVTGIRGCARLLLRMSRRLIDLSTDGSTSQTRSRVDVSRRVRRARDSAQRSRRSLALGYRYTWFKTWR